MTHKEEELKKEFNAKFADNVRVEQDTRWVAVKIEEVADWWLERLATQKQEAYDRGVTEGQARMNNSGKLLYQQGYKEGRLELLEKVLEEIPDERTLISPILLRQQLRAKFKSQV